MRSNASTSLSLWERHLLAVDQVTERRTRIVNALTAAGVPYALVGGQAVALWVASREPAAVRTTKDVDILLRREDLPRARAAAREADFDYFEIHGVGMFLDRANNHPKHGVHIVWAARKVRAEEPLPAPDLADRVEIEPGLHVVRLADLVAMKLMCNRDQDRMHLSDLADVGLIDRSLLPELPPELATRLAALFDHFHY
jgi:hypothetical protein